MPLTAFSPPGSLDDLDAAGLAAWSTDVDDLLNAARRGNPAVPNDSPRPQFFNPLGVELEGDATQKSLTWGAFPRKLSRQPAPQRWELGEERDRQEEYCEWIAERDSGGELARVVFTSEVPEYFLRLAQLDPDRLLALYQAHVSADVQLDDLMPSGSYDERNRWNLAGAMHMIQGANTLSAAVTLVAQASIVRADKMSASDLIACGVDADEDRNSDPFIVSEVNGLARAGAAVTLDDPVGLYIAGLRTPGWETPDRADPSAFWRIARGDPEHALRAVFEVPAERGYGIAGIKIDGREIRSPSQIAEFVQVKVVGLAHGFDQHAEAPRGCRDGTGPEAATKLERLGAPHDAPQLAQLIAPARRTR